MKKTYGLLLTLGLAASLLGCKKDDTTPTPTPAPTKTDMLTGKNWVVTAETISPGINVGGGVTITDLYAQMQACSKDDISRFETPNVFKDDEGATKCSSSDPQTVTGTWSFNTDQTILTITESGSTQSFNISTLTSTSMVLTTTQVQGGVTYTITVTFKN